MKYTIAFLLTLLAIRSDAQEIAGRILDDTKQPLPSAVVQVLQGGIVKGGAATDYDGTYAVKGLDPGYYDVMVVYVGLDTSLTTGVVVSANGTTTINTSMKKSRMRSKCIMITAYKIPLVDQNSPDTHTLTREQLRSIPTTEISDLAGMSPGVYQSQKGAAVNIGGARTEGTTYLIDGVVVQGNTGVNMSQGGIEMIDANGQPKFYNPSDASYKKDPENDFKNVLASPLSTMSVDVDRASYSNVRRFINEGQRPPVDAVRIEEMVNYFDYDYAQPEGKDPITIQTELTDCPWYQGHQLLHIGMQALKIKTDNLPPSNLVFLIDVSGSMESPERLPLLVAGMKLLVQQLRPIDKVSIVTYAGNAGLALPATSGSEKQTIIDALDKLEAGGSTAGGAGITLAYKIAKKNFIAGGNNRVLLATDGDFNVGVSSDNELEELIVKERETGIFLTCLGFGTDNLKDSKMEVMADKGNGNYSYIDNILEAQKTLVSEFGGTLFTVAKDVKAQIEFNPARVQGYRLIGYEDRMLNAEDFKDDKKDAGDMGSGHTVTIIYEIIPAGISSSAMRDADDLKYQPNNKSSNAYSSELATIKFRYKKPDGDTSIEMQHVIPGDVSEFSKASENTRFACSVAMFGMLLKGSSHAGGSTYDNVISMAEDSRQYDKEGYRAEFIRLVKAAKEYASKTTLK